jgi:fibronectin-binding autotransporter adhesin
MKKTNLHLLAALLGAGSFVFPGVSHAASINKANNANALDLTTSWTGGVVPGSGDIAVYSSANTASTAAHTVGAGVSFGGILFSNTPGANITINAGTGTLTLGSSGIDISLGGSRILTLGTTVNLASNQSWTTGTAAASTSQISSTGIISGSGGLTLNGASGSPLVATFLSGVNTFSGGVTLNNGAALRISSGTAAFSAGPVLTSSSIGTGNLTINGGTLFSAGGTIAPAVISVTNDFAINNATSALNGRVSIGGSSMDLNGGTRTVSLGRFSTAAGAIAGGFESLRFIANLTNGPTVNSIDNGTLRFVRGSTGTATDYVTVNFGAGTTRFEDGTGLTIGDHVITTMGTSNPFGTTAGAQPILTVEAGGYFNMADAITSRTPAIRSLSGNGTVTNFSTVAGTATLTINTQLSDTATFSGDISDGSSLTSVVAGAAGAVAVTKTGAGTQILSGTNSYSGATNVSGGTLLVNGSLTGTGNVSVAVGATLGGSGTITGDTTVNGTLSAGNSPGLLTFNNAGAGFADLTLGATSNTIFEINGLTRGVTYDAINVEGILALNGTLTLDFGFVPDVTDTFDLFNFATQSGAFTSVVFLDSGYAGSFDASTGILSLSAIPEPGTYALLGVGMAFLWVVRRRNQRVS